jgi:hypothetical protein
MPDNRKFDTRVKVHLGGLVVKAGIQELVMQPLLRQAKILGATRSPPVTKRMASSLNSSV